MSERNHPAPNNDYWHRNCFECHHEFFGPKRESLCAVCRPIRNAQLTASPAEEGREVAEVVAWIRGSGLEMLKSGDGAATVFRSEHASNHSTPLMTVAQHSRIVAAKDAEIAELRSMLGGEQCKLASMERLAELRAQPARQVGDEREQFEASMSESVYFNPEGFQHDSGAWVYSDYTTDVAWMAWSRRAALAPAAVVMPPSPYMPGVEPEALSDYERGEAQGRCDMWAEVARLNRNQIPADLIGRCIQLLEFHSGYSGDAEQYAANELRALLGKDEK